MEQSLSSPISTFFLLAPSFTAHFEFRFLLRNGLTAVGFLSTFGKRKLNFDFAF
jgi:hypothetical protein